MAAETRDVLTMAEEWLHNNDAGARETFALVSSLRSEVASLRGALDYQTKLTDEYRQEIRRGGTLSEGVPVWIRDDELRDLQRDLVNCAIVERRDPCDTDVDGCVRATLTLHRSPDSDAVPAEEPSR